MVRVLCTLKKHLGKQYRFSRHWGGMPGASADVDKLLDKNLCVVQFNNASYPDALDLLEKLAVSID